MKVFTEMGFSLECKTGTMIEIPRAAPIADEIAKDAEFFSFGTNDHTQMTFGYSRDDVGKFLHMVMQRGSTLEYFSPPHLGTLSSQVEIISDLPKDNKIIVYRCGPLVDLCRGPHAPNTTFVKAIAFLKASTAYWRGNKDRERLQRVYGISYPDKKRLKETSPQKTIKHQCGASTTSSHENNVDKHHSRNVELPFSPPPPLTLFVVGSTENHSLFGGKTNMPYGAIAGKQDVPNMDLRIGDVGCFIMCVANTIMKLEVCASEAKTPRSENSQKNQLPEAKTQEA
ncbi:threonine--tRNA ligase, mitochondrial 1 [Tanacetum coccineum]